jgi:UrcA family protein
MHTNRLFAIAFASAALTATPLVAAPAEPTRAEVHYNDLDLTSPQGEKALRTRVARAVTKVCGVADLRELHEQRQIHECRTSARDGAAPQIETALAEARSGRQFAAIDVRRNAPGI